MLLKIKLIDVDKVLFTLCLFLLLLTPAFVYGATFDQDSYALDEIPEITFEQTFNNPFGYLYIHTTGQTIAGCFDDGDGTVHLFGTSTPTNQCDTIIPPFDFHPLDDDGLTTNLYGFLEFDYDTVSTSSLFTDCVDPPVHWDAPDEEIEQIDECIEYLEDNDLPFILSTFTFGSPPQAVRFLGTNASFNTITDLSANVISSIDSVWVVVLLSVSIFLTFYIVQKLMFLFSGTEKAIVKTRRRRRK